MSDRVPASSSALASCLVLSGGAALIYEVVWSRQFALVMGHTAYATAAILAAFLGGLALGAAVASRWLRERRATARHYAQIEVVVAVGALSVPLFLEAARPVLGAAYRSLLHAPPLLGLAQAAVGTAALMLPTMAMGATLPLVIDALNGPRSGDDQSMILVGRLYALNSLGGVLGAAAAGLVLLPTLGEQATLLVGVGLNGLAALIAWGEGPDAASATDAGVRTPAESPPVPPAPASAPEPSSVSPPVALALYGWAGFSALVLQVGWARLVGVTIGTTVYGFTITVVAFISGLTIGGAALPRLRWLRIDDARAAVALKLGIAAMTLAGLQVMARLPAWVGAVVDARLPFWATWSLELALVAATVLGPTIAMGGLFPVMTRLVDRPVGAAAGAAFAANTAGNILGALAGGFLFVPILGMRGTVLAAAIMSALGAAALAIHAAAKVRARPRPSWAWPAATLAAALAAVAPFAPSWDPELLTSAPFMFGQQGTAVTAQGFRTARGKVVDMVEGVTTLAAVRQYKDRTKGLYVGGILESGTQSSLHRYLGHLGALYHGSPQNVLLVGLGVGHTAAAVLTHPVQRVDVLELSPEVVAMTEKHFAEANDHALDDDRLRLRVADGRAHLEHVNETYDLILSQPSYPWMAGAARLFTEEYFELVRSRLRPGGVAVIWFAAHSERSNQSLIAAWTRVFDRAYLARPGRRLPLFYLLGFIDVDGGPTAERIEAALAAPAVKSAAQAAYLRSTRAVLQQLVAGPSELNERARGARPNTDDNGFVELELFPTLVRQRADGSP